MTRTHDRLRHGQAGAVGMMILVWLAVVVVVGVAAIDAGSIAFTKFRLADVASTASTQAANAYQVEHEHRDRVSGGGGLHRGGRRFGETGEEGVRGRPDHGRGHDHRSQGRQYDPRRAS